MKKHLFLAVCTLLFLTACAQEKQISIEITNPSGIDRKGEIVEIEWQSLPGFNADSLVVLDEDGAKIPFQVIYHGGETPLSLLFPATIPGNEKKVYTIRAGVSATFPVKTFGRQVPERKDDFAWENDRVVYRVYGPALANEYPSNGYDLWLKKTDKMIINQFYENDLAKIASYHVDHGEGLDCYAVGHTLGAGAIVPFVDNKIWIENQYSTARLLDSGVLRTVFELTYDSVVAGDKILSEKLIISLDAGSQFNKAEVHYSGDYEKLDLAAGITLHNRLGIISNDLEKGIITYSEDAVSDGGIPAGRSYIGIVFTTPIKDIFEDKGHIAGIVEYPGKEPLIYYFGGGWSQWGFNSDNDWQEYVEKYAGIIHSRLTIKIRK
jgi:hypothetical protein